MRRSKGCRLTLEAVGQDLSRTSRDRDGGVINTVVDMGGARWFMDADSLCTPLASATA